MKRLAFLSVPILALFLGFGMYHYVSKSWQYDAQTLKGDKITWRSLESKWIVINFFAEWCAPCLREIPELNAFYQAAPADTHMYMVSYDQISEQKLAEIASKYSISVPLIVNSPDLVLPMTFPKALPATFVIAPNGEVAGSLYGEVDAEQLAQTLSTAKLAQQN